MNRSIWNPASRASSIASRFAAGALTLLAAACTGAGDSDVATKTNLDLWIGRVPQPFTATLDSVDPQPGMESFFNVPRDQFLVVDLKTMQLIDLLDSDPQAAVDEVEGLLPPLPDAGM